MTVTFNCHQTQNVPLVVLLVLDRIKLKIHTHFYSQLTVNLTRLRYISKHQTLI